MGIAETILCGIAILVAGFVAIVYITAEYSLKKNKKK